MTVTINSSNPEIPETYSRWITTSGVEVWGVKSFAGKPETPHRHDGGWLWAKEAPIVVRSWPDNVIRFSWEGTGNSMNATYLPPADMHYATTPQDYEAVFITSRRPLEDKEIRWLTSPSSSKYLEHGCWQIELKETAELLTEQSDFFVVSEVALKCFEIRDDNEKMMQPLANLAYFVYHIQPGKNCRISQISQQIYLLVI